jgi:hypothetical protein
MQIRPAPYVLVFSMTSATSWSLLPRNALVLRNSIVFAPGGGRVTLRPRPLVVVGASA